LKTQSYSIPFGMIFKKYHCSKCGAQLEKEKTHRVVTKEDKDYYQYHDYVEFPRRDVDVYDYRLKCPSCGARIAFDEQCIIERIQKKCGQEVLSNADIKEHYEECKEGTTKESSGEIYVFRLLFVLLPRFFSALSKPIKLHVIVPIHFFCLL